MRGALVGSCGGAAVLRRALAARAATTARCPSGLAATNTLFTAFIESSPRHLDPTASYWNNDTPYTYQIYEPPYGYHYLKRPFELVPKTAAEVVKPRYLDKDGKPLPDDAPGEQVAESVYDIRIKPGILFQPHPAFAQGREGPTTATTHMKPGETRRAAHAAGLRAQRHARTGRRRLRLRAQAPRHDAHHDADLRHLLRVRARPEGLRRADQGRGREAARRACDPASLDKPFLDFRRWPLAGAERAREAPAAHPHQGQVPAVEVLDGDDLHGADAVGGRCVLRPARHGRQRA